MSSNSVPLQFGIEVEFLLKPKPVMNDFLKIHGFKHEITTQGNTEDQKANRTAIRASIVDIFQMAGVEASLISVDYQQWSPVDEPPLDEMPEFWRCEIVSRILNPSSDWQDEIHPVFLVLSDNFDIHLTPGCLMHVHVTPFGTGKYNIDQVKRILKAVVYYDAPVTNIMPADRKANAWSQSNVEKSSAWRTECLQVPQNKWAPLFDSFDKHEMIEQILDAMPQAL